MLDLRTVYECNRCLGCKTLHPQVSIINLENPSLEEDAVKIGRASCRERVCQYV